MAHVLYNSISNIKKNKMNELKSKLTTLKSLAKELMKRGNLSEYFNILNQVNSIEKQMQLIKL